MNKRRAWQKAQFGLMCSNSIGKAYTKRDALGAATEGLAAGAKSLEGMRRDWVDMCRSRHRTHCVGRAAAC